MKLVDAIYLPFLSRTLASGTTSPAARSNISWFDCKQNGSIPITCGTLSVPLDYADLASNRTIDLQIVKVNATKQPSKGSILLNPGGPGEIGRSFLTNTNGAGSALLLMTGGEHDLLAFDPRGTGETIPFSCYPPGLVGAEETLEAQYHIPDTVTASDTALGTVWAGKEILAELCYKNEREIGELIGTAYVARDMMRIVDALGEDGLLRYWGFSYGTALGTTVAAMFPDRMDKVVLDGVLNPEQYWSGRSIQQVTDSEATFDGFFSGCFQNPQYCALARNCSSPQELRGKVEDLLEQVKYHPIALGPDISTDLVDYQTLKILILEALYGTVYWPSLAQAIDAVLTRNRKSYVEAFEILVGALVPQNFPTYAGSENLLGIRCSDSSFRTNNLAEILPLVDELETLSPIIGDMQATSIIIPCARWKMRAKERYTGGFNNIRTNNPLLFVGNTFDPLTPLVSAQNASAGFDGSVVLQHYGHGHTSLSQPSLCTAKAIRTYFVNGTLPPEGTICQSSVPSFANSSQTLLEVLAPLANSSKRSTEEAAGSDAALLAAVVRLGTETSFHRRLL